MRRTPPQCPLLEFDPDREALFEPAATQAPVDAPELAVGCFFPDIIAAAAGGASELMRLPSREPLLTIEWNRQPLGVFYPGQGAPLAAATLERVIAAGCGVIVFCGGAGALVSELALGDVVIPNAALRDEGTSFHYVAPTREIAADSDVVSTLADVCEAAARPYIIGKTWTTDGLFRETRAKVARRRAEGCITVEAETSALLAVGQARGVRVAVLLYAGDDLSGEEWQEREWKEASAARERLFELAAGGALALGTSSGMS